MTKINLFLKIFTIVTIFSQGALADFSLDEKISLQESRFLKLRRELAERSLQKSFTPMSEEEWNSKAAGNGPERFSDQDLKELKSRHHDIIGRAQGAAEHESNKIFQIQLQKVRERGLENQFCQNLPKGGMLHVHPWGTISRSTLRRIMSTINPKIDLQFLRTLTSGKDAALNSEEVELLAESLSGHTPNYSDLKPDSEAYKRFENLFFLSRETHAFKRFMGVFSLVLEYFFKQNRVSGYNPLIVLWQDFAIRAFQNKVNYVEVTQNFNSETIEKAQRSTEKVSELIAQLEAGGPNQPALSARVIVALDRTQDPKKVAGFLETLLSLPSFSANGNSSAGSKSGVVAVNLINSEEAYPSFGFQQAYGLILAKRPSLWRPGISSAQDVGIFATAHAGEHGRVQNVRDLLIMGVDRIGHGIKLAEDLPTLEFARKLRLPVEINLISNLRLRSVDQAKNHPMLPFLRLGLRLSFSTDDEGIFESDMNQECLLMLKSFPNLTYVDFREMALNSIHTSFAEAPLKQKLGKKLESDLAQFEETFRKVLNGQ